LDIPNVLILVFTHIIFFVFVNFVFITKSIHHTLHESYHLGTNSRKLYINKHLCLEHKLYSLRNYITK